MASRRFRDDPNMSDTTILVKLEDLISMAMGPPDKNTVNFKLIQTILHILARQMRVLETNVEIRVQEIKEMSPERKSPRKKSHGHSSTTDESSSSRKRDKHAKEKVGKDHDKSVKKYNKETDADKETNKDKELTKGGKGMGKEDKEDKDKASAKDEKEGEIDKGKRKGSAKDAKESKSAKESARDEKGKESSKSEKGKQREKEQPEKDDGKQGVRSGTIGRDKSPATGIIVTEKQRDKEKVIVVEKGHTQRSDSKTKVGSIEVVTQSQFAKLEAAINELKSIAGPISIPELPDNEKLRSDLASGSASLTDTMKAMQVTVRLKAVEEAIGRMAGLLTALSATGALPEDLVEKFGAGFDYDDQLGKSPMSTPRPVAIDGMSERDISPSDAEPGRKSLPKKHSSAMKSTAASKQSEVESFVTHPEMDDALLRLKESLSKDVTNMTTKAAAAADTALNTTRVLAEKLDVALKVNSRISTLNSMVTDYAEQLTGFDAGLTSQMQSFQEQMAQMRSDLKDGLMQLEQVNNNAETAAIMDLTERHGELVAELDRTVFAHQGLAVCQKQLGDELKSLMDCVESLQEQKADRDEVLDGLRDKADNTRLAGLLTEEEFAIAKEQLDRRLEVCYDKFKKQDAVWMMALNDLQHVVEAKVELIQLLGMKEDTQQELQELHEIIKRLAEILGEPKAAILTRKLAKDASCGVCLVPAMMEPTDANYGAPPPLPAMRPKPVGAPAEEPESCLEDWQPPHLPDPRKHACHRWVGGSHTLISDHVRREQAPPLQVQAIPTKKYAGYGSDGRLYMMEEELHPCIECNVLKPGFEAEQDVLVPPPKELVENGAGDQA